jgi:hypothetical protein
MPLKRKSKPLRGKVAGARERCAQGEPLAGQKN